MHNQDVKECHQQLFLVWFIHLSTRPSFVFHLCHISRACQPCLKPSPILGCRRLQRWNQIVFTLCILRVKKAGSLRTAYKQLFFLHVPYHALCIGSAKVIETFFPLQRDWEHPLTAPSCKEVIDHPLMYMSDVKPMPTVVTLGPIHTAAKRPFSMYLL